MIKGVLCTEVLILNHVIISTNLGGGHCPGLESGDVTGSKHAIKLDYITMSCEKLTFNIVFS